MSLDAIIGRARTLSSRGVEERSDWITPLCMLGLCIAGVFFIYSAQSYSQGTQWKTQIVWMGLGAIAYFGVSLINYKLFLQNAHLIYGLCLLLLIPLAIEAWGANLPLVTTNFGSTRWIKLGPISIQPSELAKVGTLVILASMLARSDLSDFKESLKILGKVGLIFLIPFLLIFVQPDLGTCLVFLPMLFSLLYVSRLSQRFFAAVIGLFLLGTLVITVDMVRYANFLEENNITAEESQKGNLFGSEHSLLPLRDYQRNRIFSLFAPDLVDPQGIGVSWNRNQSLIAVASGGLQGKGHNEGTQAKLGYLPSSVSTNDFILSVLLEEKGFVGGAVVIALFSAILINTLRIAGMARDRFGMLLVIGVSAIFMVHVFVNVGMTIGIMPITGLPLPFVSYGGSFMIVCCILQGLVQSVYRFRKDFS